MEKQLIKFTNSFGDTLYGYSWNTINPKANVIIFTGMQEHAERYDNFAKFLNSHKFDVYCIDHYGQGLNIKTPNLRGVWPTSGFSKMVKTFGELETKLQKTGLPIYIFAHSMGSFMAQEYLQRFHAKVQKVILCGTDCANPFVMSFAYNLSKILVNKKNYNLPNKRLAKLVTGNFNKSVVNPTTPCDWLSYNKENVQNYLNDPNCGYIGTSGFYREFLKGMRRISRKKFMDKIRQTTTILIIAGEEDPVGHMGKGPKKLAKRYRKLGLGGVELKLYPKMRHEILNEIDNQVVYNDILEFLNAQI